MSDVQPGDPTRNGTHEKHVRPDPSHRKTRGARGLREIGVLGAISLVAVTEATDTSPRRRRRQRAPAPRAVDHWFQRLG